MRPGSGPPSRPKPSRDAEEDARQSLTRIELNPFILRRASVRGFVHDDRNGRVLEVLVVAIAPEAARALARRKRNARAS